MGVYHSGFYAGMPQKILYVAHICSVFEQMGGKTVSQSVHGGFKRKLIFSFFLHTWLIKGLSELIFFGQECVQFVVVALVYKNCTINLLDMINIIFYKKWQY